ncbi:MAG: prolyl oligopeptidase family serine peptidase [Armatimonadota bacterium]
MIRRFVLLLVAFPALAYSQGSAADYARADSFGQRFSGKVLNERLTLNWLKGGKAWYVRQLPAGKSEFVLVDAAAGKKALAFDHRAVALALSKAAGKPVDPTQLPPKASFSDDASAVTFTLDDAYQVNLKTFEVRKGRDPVVGGLKAYAPEEVPESGGGGDQTSITFRNDSAEPLKIHWIQDDGVLREYQTLQPGKEWSIQTSVTHFWCVTRMDGTKLATYKPDRNGSTAFLDGKRVPFTPARQRPQNESPDGKWRITFTDNQANLFDVGTKEKKQLTTDGSAANAYRGPVFWSPDSTSVVFYQVKPEESHPLNIVMTSPPDQFQPKLTSRQYLKPGDKIAQPTICAYTLGDVQLSKDQPDMGSKKREIWEIDKERWISDSKFIYRVNYRGHQRMDLKMLSVQSVEQTAFHSWNTKILETSKTFIDWTAKSFFEYVPGAKIGIWQSEMSGWSHLYSYDFAHDPSMHAPARLRPITRGQWVVRALDRVDEDKRQIWFQASGMDGDQDPYNVHFCRVNFDGTGFTRLTEGNGNHRVSYSPDGAYLLDSYSRPDLAPVHEVRSALTGKKVLDLEVADASELTKAGFQMPRVFSAKGRDGKTDIWGHVYLPTNFDPAKSYPVVEDIYAGPHSSHVPKNFHTNAGGMQMAELGFIVVRIDGMGTSNRSKAFHDVCYQNIVDAGFPDRILWMKSVAREIPQMDLTRVGIYGTSAGGQNTLHALLTQGDFYKVGVADCGCYDNRMDKIWWNEQWMGLVGPHYEAQSGRTLAKNLRGKLLLLLGEADTNVDPASTYQVIDALIKADKDFDFVVIPNVGHGAVGHPYGKRKLRDFLVKNLLGVEPRWK